MAAAEAQDTTPPANDDCLACHGDESTTRADGRPVFVDQGAYAASVHGQLDMACVDCHADLASLAEYPHPDKLAPVDCATCHEGESAQYATSIHARPPSRAQGQTATCVDCHGTHDIRSKTDPESRTSHFRLPQTCGRCHGDAQLFAKVGAADDVVFQAFQDSIHGQALSRSGLTVAPNCSDCHGAHGIVARANPASPVYKTNVPATCGKCHQGIEQQYAHGVHATALAQGNLLAPVCSDCHTAHRIQQAEVAQWRLEVTQECGTCHQEAMKTYRDTYHGQITNLGFARVATCADCHGAHEILPLANHGSSVAVENRVKTCQKCHPAANENFARYDPHADPENRSRNPLLYYASRFMSLLLVGVFSFFGLHTTLWLSRSVYEMRRDKTRMARMSETTKREVAQSPHDHEPES